MNRPDSSSDPLPPAARASTTVSSRNPFTHPPAGQLTAPTNTVTKRIFVAATRMNDGKTTTCLGLYAALQALYPRVGFIKPVGQRFIQVEGHSVDEDSYLLDQIYNVHVPLESMSPVTVDGTFTRRFLKNPAPMLDELIDKICRAFDRVSWEKDFTLIEGTGHAGVGSVFELSNARVARLLDAKVILVSPGGIGRPIDEIALNKALFDQVGVPVLGAILNKVEPDKIELVREYAGLGLERLGVPLLGVLPRQKALTAPNLAQVVEEIGGRWINGHASGAQQRVHRVVVGAASAKRMLDSVQPGALIITPGDRDDVFLAAMTSALTAGGSTIAGIILTDDITPHPRLLELVERTDIAVIGAKEDLYTITSQITNLTVKTQPSDTDKIPIIKQLITEHVDLQKILRSC